MTIERYDIISHGSQKPHEVATQLQNGESIRFLGLGRLTAAEDSVTIKLGPWSKTYSGPEINQSCPVDFFHFFPKRVTVVFWHPSQMSNP